MMSTPQRRMSGAPQRRMSGTPQRRFSNIHSVTSRMAPVVPPPEAPPSAASPSVAKGGWRRKLHVVALSRSPSKRQMYAAWEAEAAAWGADSMGASDATTPPAFGSSSSKASFSRAEGEGVSPA